MDSEGKVLIVEDDEQSRELAFDVLADAGYQVAQADSGEQESRDYRSYSRPDTRGRLLIPNSLPKITLSFCISRIHLPTCFKLSERRWIGNPYSPVRSNQAMGWHSGVVSLAYPLAGSHSNLLAEHFSPPILVCILSAPNRHGQLPSFTKI